MSAAAHLNTAAAAEISYEVEASASYVGEAKFKRGSATVGDISQFDTRALFVTSTQLRDSFLLRLGVDWQRYEFDRPAGAPVPGTLQLLNFIIGADMTLGESWLIRVELHPGFAGTGDDLDANSARIPAVLGASYIVSSDLQFVAGVGIDANRKYPVLPGVGLRWKFAEQWVLNGVLPAPRLEYTPTKGLMFYAGGEIREDTYRVNERLGATRGVRNLEGTILDYWEIRGAVGVSWKPRPGWTVELEGGVVPFRDFDYYRADERVRGVETPGYIRLGIKGSF